MVPAIEASGIRWRSFCVGSGEEASAEHSNRPSSRVETKRVTRRWCVDKCAWLCVFNVAPLLPKLLSRC